MQGASTPTNENTLASWIHLQTALWSGHNYRDVKPRAVKRTAKLKLSTVKLHFGVSTARTCGREEEGGPVCLACLPIHRSHSATAFLDLKYRRKRKW